MIMVQHFLLNSNYDYDLDHYIISIINLLHHYIYHSIHSIHTTQTTSYDVNHQSWHDDGISDVKCRMGEKCNCSNVIQMMNVVS